MNWWSDYTTKNEIYPVNQMSFFSVRMRWRAESPSPVDLTKPLTVIRLGLARLMVPSALS